MVHTFYDVHSVFFSCLRGVILHPCNDSSATIWNHQILHDLAQIQSFHQWIISHCRRVTLRLCKPKRRSREPGIERPVSRPAEELLCLARVAPCRPSGRGRRGVGVRRRRKGGTKKAGSYRSYRICRHKRRRISGFTRLVGSLTNVRDLGSSHPASRRRERSSVGRDPRSRLPSVELSVASSK